MSPDLEEIYSKVFAELTKQVERRFSQLEKQLGMFASEHALAEPQESPGASSLLLVVNAESMSWAFPLATLSHFSWEDEVLRAYFLAASGERLVEFRFRGNVKEKSLRPLWEQMAANIAAGNGHLTFPCDLSGGRIEAAVI